MPATDPNLHHHLIFPAQRASVHWMNRIVFNHSLVALSLCVLILTACDDAAVETYTVETQEQTIATPSENMPASPILDMASQSVPTGAGDAEWSAPENWSAYDGGPMRKASWRVLGEDGRKADLAFTSFPGDVGGELANINRWRNQLGLAPVSQVEEVSPISISDGSIPFRVVELKNPAGDGILAAYAPVGDATWFLKMTGPSILLKAELPAFKAFVRSIRPR